MADIEEEYGNHFEQVDMDRVGFFDDRPQGPFDPYEPYRPYIGLRENMKKGRQMMGRLKGGLFQKDVQRIFTGECTAELSLGPTKKKSQEKDKKIDLGVMMPPGGSKWHSTPGDWYGCIGKQPQRFNPETKPPGKKPDKMPPNPMTAPNPRGGPGYLRITINPYISMYGGPEPYEEEATKQIRSDERPRRFVSMCLPKPYFDDNPYRPSPVKPKREKKEKELKPPQKSLFHLHFPPGTFAKYPIYMSDRIPAKKKKKGKDSKESKQEVLWVPSGPDYRTKYTISIIEKVTHMSCNSQNYADYTEQVYPLDY